MTFKKTMPNQRSLLIISSLIIISLIIFYTTSSSTFSSSQQEQQQRQHDLPQQHEKTTDEQNIQYQKLIKTEIIKSEKKLEKEIDSSPHETYFGSSDWKQLSISNPTDRFHFNSREQFAEFYQQQRDFFFPSTSSSNEDNTPQQRQNSDDDKSIILRTNTSFSYCYVPQGGGKTVMNSISSQRKYNMKAELCWAPMSKIRQFQKKKKKFPHLMENSKGCLGVVRVSKRDIAKPSYCDTTKNIKISDNKHWAEDVLRKTVGPLHLRLLLEGPEVVTATVFFDHFNCEYWLHFYVQSPGQYGINFKFVHDDFWGVDETSHRTKHNLNAYCFPRSLPMLTCEMSDDVDVDVDDEKNNINTNLNLNLERWVQRPFGVPKFANRWLIANTLQMIPFSSHHQVVGVDPRAVPPYGQQKLATKDNVKYQLSPWLASTKEQTDVDGNDALTKKKKNNKMIFDYPFEKWLSQDELKRIAKKISEGHQASILVIGDSQSRSITWSLKNYLQTAEITSSSSSGKTSDNKKEADLSFALRDKDGNKIKKSTGEFLDDKSWKVTFSWDSGLDLLAHHQQTLQETSSSHQESRSSSSSNGTLLREQLKNLQDSNIIIAGLGHHPASWLQWTFQTYFERSKKIASNLCHLISEKKKKVFWYGAPSWPKAKLVDNFRGTNQRLAVFNGLILKHFEDECERKRGVKIVMAGSRKTRSPENDSSGPVAQLYLVDFYGITSPVMKYSKDGSHFDGTVVVSTCADKVFKSLV